MKWHATRKSREQFKLSELMRKLYAFILIYTQPVTHVIRKHIGQFKSEIKSNQEVTTYRK